MTLVGAHVESDKPLQYAEVVGADCFQMFLSNPQGWKKPPPRPDADELIASGKPIYVHAPYLINVASPNNRIRMPSRKNLTDACEAAAAVKAAAVIVHAGHADDDIQEGIGRWKRTTEIVKSDVKILIENTAGGNNAMARRWDVLARLWDAVGDSGWGFCLDTCHVHASGEDVSDAVERCLKIVGHIDVLHCNDSKDPAGTGRDRHENLGRGTIGADVLRDMIRAAKAPVVIVETPRDLDALARDVQFVRDALR